MLPTKTLAVIALAVAPAVLTVTGPAEAAEAATVTSAPAAAVHHSRHWLHCHTRTRPCAKHKAHPKPKHRPASRVTNARAKVLQAARRALGRPYRYGAAGPSSFDCSGLVQWSYRAAGKRMPRTVSALARGGHRAIHPRVGDVLLYGTYHAAIVAAVKGNRVTSTIVARHSGTRIAYQKPYAAYQVRAYLA